MVRIMTTDSFDVMEKTFTLLLLVIIIITTQQGQNKRKLIFIFTIYFLQTKRIITLSQWECRNHVKVLIGWQEFLMFSLSTGQVCYLM